MSKERLTIDLEEFKPEAKTIDPVAKVTLAAAAESNGFRTRHAAGAAISPESETGARRRGRKRTTNRNTPFTVKLRVETNNQIYDLADHLECTAIAEVIELALGALQREMDEGINPRERAMVSTKARP